jgi:hypothetical protein
VSCLGLSFGFTGYVFALNITMGLTKEMSSDVKKKQKGCSLEDTSEDGAQIHGCAPSWNHMR